MNTLDYFLKANLYGLLFVGCYWLLLRRHTFFGLNRAYLLLSTLLTLVLPLINLPTRSADALPVPVGVIALPTSSAPAVTTNPAPANIATADVRPDWGTIGLILYCLIALGLIVRLATRIWRLLRFIQRFPQRTYQEYILVQASQEQEITFSFFHYLVLSPSDARSEFIIRHELVHIRQGHSADVIGLAIIRAVFWACPALWLIDRMLRQVHEFLADKAVNQPQVYAQLLVDYAFGMRPDGLTNGFFNPS